jgi:hypothetical protein
LRSKIIALVVVAALATSVVYFLTSGRDAESSPAAGKVEDMTNQGKVIPIIDANRPAVTETAAFALG